MRCWADDASLVYEVGSGTSGQFLFIQKLGNVDFCNIHFQTWTRRLLIKYWTLKEDISYLGYESLQCIYRPKNLHLYCDEFETIKLLMTSTIVKFWCFLAKKLLIECNSKFKVIWSNTLRLIRIHFRQRMIGIISRHKHCLRDTVTQISRSSFLVVNADICNILYCAVTLENINILICYMWLI